VAILSCVRAPHAQDFLSTIPIDGVGQRMNHRQFRFVLCYRLAVPMFSEGNLCPGCNVHRMDQWGDHVVHCSSEVGVKFRHNPVSDILVDICSEVGIMVRKETSMGFLSDDGKDLRPVDFLLFNWLQGKDACLDVTCISPFAGVAQLEYSRIIGMLMYLMTSTRPDLAYDVSRLSRYTSNPSNAHWKAITRVLHYVRYSRDYGLDYDKHLAVMEGYSDANWISDVKDSRSTSGYVFTLEGAAISWKSSKQTVIAKSTMESEFIALDKCGEEAKWLRQFVEDIPRWPKPVTAISIHCDSQSAIGRAQSIMYNGKSRHICRRHNSIQQLLSTGVISIEYVASKDNIVDPFTKGLSRYLVSKSSKGMGLKPLKE
nr:zinc finger, CCHC-type [Tanacetum cinerariifolium]